jgi:hypothetical protein
MDLVNDHAASLSVARIAVGAGAWLAPQHRLWSSVIDAPPQSSYTMRLFGAREIALGAMTLLAPPAVKASVLKIGIAVDAADAAASALAARSGAMRPVSALLLTAMALGGVGSGVAALTDAS